jgi:hypothetical protein
VGARKLVDSTAKPSVIVVAAGVSKLGARVATSAALSA